MFNLQTLQQTITTTGGAGFAIPHIGLLILGIVLLVIGWALQRANAPAKTLWVVLFWLGVACIVIWFILLLLAFAFGYVCC